MGTLASSVSVRLLNCGTNGRREREPEPAVGEVRLFPHKSIITSPQIEGLTFSIKTFFEKRDTLRHTSPTVALCLAKTKPDQEIDSRIEKGRRPTTRTYSEGPSDLLIVRERRRRAPRRERQKERTSWVKNVKPLLPSTARAHSSQPSAVAHDFRSQELRHVGVLLRAAV